MNSISITYSLKWRLKTDHKYQLSECGKLFNIRTGRIKKKVLNGSSIGYWFGKKFITITNIRHQFEKISEEYCPF